MAQMRSKDEVQRAHDLIYPFVVRELELEELSDMAGPMQVALDALCWVLRHDGNPAFGEFLAGIEATAATHGMELLKGDDD